MGARKFTPQEKVAALMLAFGPDISAEIMRSLGMNEATAIARTLSRLGKISEEDLDAILTEFAELLQAPPQGSVMGGAEATASILRKAFRGQDVSSVFGIGANRIDALDGVDPKQIATLIGNEHPQTIALILAHLDKQIFAQVLKLLPPSRHTDLLMRIAKLQPTSAEVITELNEALRTELQQLGRAATQKRGGIRSVSEVLGKLDKASSKRLLEELSDRNPELAEQVRGQMFVFDDIAKLADRDVQTVLSAVKKEVLVVALRAASDAVKGKIFTNLSQRAASLLQDDLESQGKIRLTEVQDAQRQVLQIVHQLAEQGKIVLNADDTYV